MCAYTRPLPSGSDGYASKSKSLLPFPFLEFIYFVVLGPLRRSRRRWRLWSIYVPMAATTVVGVD